MKAEKMLKQCENQDEDNQEYNNAASITYNNIGCYYQKIEDYKLSLKHLQIALKYNRKIENDEINQSSTHLNICACFSQTGEHDKAYQHSKVALQLLPVAHRKMKQKLAEKGEGVSPRSKNEYEEKRKNLIMTLIIAYHNAGVECEYLQKFSEAQHHYENGSGAGLKYFGENDEMTKLLKRCLNQVKRIQASKSTQHYIIPSKFGSDVNSLTSSNSKDIRNIRIKNNRENSSENRSFANSSVNRSPEIAYRPVVHTKHKSQDRIIKRPSKQAHNISYTNKSPTKIVANKLKHMKNKK